jgi:hypothetical protein
MQPTEYHAGVTMRCSPSCAGYRFPAKVIGYAVWLYFRFPLSLRMVEEMLAARGIVVSHETVRQWGLKFGREVAKAIHQRTPQSKVTIRHIIPMTPIGLQPRSGQAEVIWRGQEGLEARLRASPAQRIEQSRRELAPTNATTRAPDATV